jgi:hypothetical protein
MTTRDARSRRYYQTQDSNTSSLDERALQEEIAVHLDALHELGPEYRDAVAQSLVEALRPLIRQEVEQYAAKIVEEHLHRRTRWQSSTSRNPALIMTLLVMAVPLTAIAAGVAGISGMLVLWTFLILILILHRLGLL